MRTDLGALLEHHNGDLLAGLGGQLPQADRRRQARRAGADDHHVDLHFLAFRCLGHFSRPSHANRALWSGLAPDI